MIDGKALRKARRMLRVRAHSEFPEMVAYDQLGPSIEAALVACEIDVEDTLAFVAGVVEKNSNRLAEHGITSPYQMALFRAAIANGIAIGVEATDHEIGGR